VQYGEHPFLALLRLLGASFRLGRAFGTEVRVYGAGLIILLLVAVPLRELSWLPWGSRLVYVLGGTLMLYAVVWVHEMGHVIAARRWHVHTPVITLSPLGGLAHLDGAAPSPKAEIVVSLAGPLTHALLLAPAYALTRLVPLEPIAGRLLAEHFWSLNAGLALFNLLPFYPLDGGRVLRGLLSLRMHANRATIWAARVGIAGAVVMLLYGLSFVGGLWGGMLMMVAISGILACVQAMRAARWVESPYGEARQPWEEDPDAWKRGAAPEERGPSASPPADAASAAELDRLLDRVRAVGLAGLTEREREALKRASEARRPRS
jgi:Zn-dependent protease